MSGAAQAELSTQEQTRLAQIQADPKRALQHILYLESKLNKLEEERRLERARRFGASSEVGDHQANLFDEAEVNNANKDIDECMEPQTIEVAAHTKRRPKRKPLPADLPRVDIHHDLDDKRCGCCGDEMRRIGEKTSEQLDV